VSGITAVARTYLVTNLRERITLFWFLVFPLFLLTILTLIFGGLGSDLETTFAVGLVNSARANGGPTDFSSMVERAFVHLSSSDSPDRRPLFRLHRPADGEDPRAFLDREKDAVRIGDRALLIEIPAGFNEALLASVGGAGPPAAIAISVSGGRISSEIARSIADQVIAGVNERILTVVGRFDPSQALTVESARVGSNGRDFLYVDFLLPGVVLMAFFTAGLFGVPGTILFGRERKILKRYWVTPLETRRFLAGFSLGHLALCATQFVALYLLGRFAFGARVALLSPLSLAFLALAASVFLAFGFLISSLARTANAAMAIANILNLPMMFLGGLFFPIGELPAILRAVMLANPVTYLADGLRTALGVTTPMVPCAATIAVPVAWAVVCVVVAARRLQWGAEQ